MATGDLIIPEGFGNAVLQWTIAGKVRPMTVGMGFAATGSSDPAEMADAVYDAVTAAGAPCAANKMMDSFRFLGAIVTYNDAGTIIEGASSGPVVAGTIGTGLPMIISSTYLVQKRTGLVGRKFRGRFYWPCTFLNEGGIDALGFIDSITAGIVQAQFDVAYNALLSGSPVSIIPNVLHHVPATGTAPVPTPITSFRFLGKVATQRRRIR